MTAIILAAGVGKRLHGASGGKPKCLIRIGGRSLLERLLQQLAAAGVRDAVIVVGFGADVVRAEIGDGPAGLRVTFVDNPRFREGAILSLWSARDHLNGPALVMDADVLCPQAMIDALVRSSHENCFLLAAKLDAGQTGIEHEEVYPDLLARVAVGFERVDDWPWTEIDFPEDVTRAEREILPRLDEAR